MSSLSYPRLESFGLVYRFIGPCLSARSISVIHWLYFYIKRVTIMFLNFERSKRK